MRAWGKTDTGKVRSLNQDAFLVELTNEDAVALCIVCDGMGGAKAGEVASVIGATAFAEATCDKIDVGTSIKGIKAVISEAAHYANMQVFERSEADPDCSGMGTTLVAAAANSEGAVLINIGDSRAYLISDEGISKITRDHSVVEDMLLMGDLTREEARQHPSKNLITRALGTEAEAQCDIYECEVKTGDCILLCSDGLTNMATEQEILYEVLHGEGHETVCDRLIALANERGGLDNITAILLEV